MRGNGLRRNQELQLRADEMSRYKTSFEQSPSLMLILPCLRGEGYKITQTPQSDSTSDDDVVQGQFDVCGGVSLRLEY